MRIVLTGGGTLGHCMPNVALLPELKKLFDEIDYIGSKAGLEKDVVTGNGVPFHEIEVCKLRRSLSVKNLAIPFLLARGKRQSVRILKKLRPDVVFSKGGYVALPVALACKKLKIPLVCHESDLSVGLANRLCLPFAACFLTAFPDTAAGRKNARFVGAPLRDSLFSATRKEGLQYFGFSGKKPVLLVLGGSLGSESVNRAVLQILDQLLEKFDVLHLVGEKNSLPLPRKEGYVVRNFEPKMEFAYAAASLALSRAGANALFELTACGVPTLAVPLPSGRGDQKQNAAFFEKRGAVMVLNEEDFHTKSLYDELMLLKKRAPELKAAAEKLKLADVNQKIVRILCGVANGKGLPEESVSSLSGRNNAPFPKQKGASTAKSSTPTAENGSFSATKSCGFPMAENKIVPPTQNSSSPMP